MPKIELKSSPILASISMTRRPSAVLDVTPVNEVDLHELLHHHDTGLGGDGSVADVNEVFAFLNECGFHESNTDPRLAPVWETLRNEFPSGYISCEELTRLKRNHLLVQKALNSDLGISDFARFTEIVTRIFLEAQKNCAGEVASYIPQLASVDPELFGVSICTVDGQRVSIGDAAHVFSVQSVGKVVTYSIALETNGQEAVHKNVGMEPSGRNFNERVLLPSGIPHNPLINTGAIMCASLVYKKEPRWKRFEKVADYWRRLSGGTTDATILQSTFLAERETANRNFCLAHMMAEGGEDLFPTDLKGIQTVLDDYFSYCSLGVTTDAMSVVAATYANGGLNPITDERVLSPETVTASLSVMMTCGMYDASGEFSSVNGFPGKSGVSGIIMAVIPGVCGICTYSPRIDGLGNSVRGLDFFSRLAREVMAAPLYKVPSKQGSITTAFGNQFDWRTSGKESVIKKFGIKEFSSLWWAASMGDELRIRQLAARGIDVNESNYSNRNALNFAITKDAKISTIALLLDLNANLGDEYFASYLEDAKRVGRTDIAEFLQKRRHGPIPEDLMHELKRTESSQSLGSPARIPVERFFVGQPRVDLAEALASAGIAYDASKNPRCDLYVRALCGKLVIPNWSLFVSDISECLSDVESELLVALTSSDAQRVVLSTPWGRNTLVRSESPVREEGPSFAIDSIVRIALYELAIDRVGEDLVYSRIGREPSGQPESSLRMNSDGLPYNAFTLAGCLVVCDMLLRVFSRAEILRRIRVRIGIPAEAPDEVSLVDERKYAERISCVYYLLSSDSLDPLSSEAVGLLSACHRLPVTLPLLGDYARSLVDSPHVLALMYTCGMDEVSGAWSFRFGLPAKSNSSGAAIVVVPGVVGYAIRASGSKSALPEGISEFQKNFDFIFSFHLFKRQFLGRTSHDPTLFFGSNQLLMITQFISAAFHGDVSSMKHMVAEGLDVNSQDMDGRTALHIATAFGHTAACDWLESVGADAKIRDVWGLTPSFEASMDGL